MATPKKSIKTLFNVVNVEALNAEMKRRNVNKAAFSEECGYSPQWLNTAMVENRFSGAIQVALREKLNIDIENFIKKNDPVYLSISDVIEDTDDAHFIRDMTDKELFNLIRDAVKEAFS